jgi:hypothetical protein
MPPSSTLLDNDDVGSVACERRRSLKRAGSQKDISLTLEASNFRSQTGRQIWFSTRQKDQFVIKSLSSGAFDAEWKDVREDEALRFVCFYHFAIAGGNVDFDVNFTAYSGDASQVFVPCNDHVVMLSNPRFRHQNFILRDLLRTPMSQFLIGSM